MPENVARSATARRAERRRHGAIPFLRQVGNIGETVRNSGLSAGVVQR